MIVGRHTGWAGKCEATGCGMLQGPGQGPWGAPWRRRRRREMLWPQEMLHVCPALLCCRFAQRTSPTVQYWPFKLWALSARPACLQTPCSVGCRDGETRQSLKQALDLNRCIQAPELLTRVSGGRQAVATSAPAAQRTERVRKRQGYVDLHACANRSGYATARRPDLLPPALWPPPAAAACRQSS